MFAIFLVPEFCLRDKQLDRDQQGRSIGLQRFCLIPPEYADVLTRFGHITRRAQSRYHGVTVPEPGFDAIDI
ncbi:MAG TPA: hypothetical protein VF243_02760, partial [Nitrosospira sp.]